METMRNSPPKLLTMLCASTLSIFSLTSVSDAAASEPRNANCIAFSTAITQETLLKGNEDKLKVDENAFKQTDDHLKNIEDISAAKETKAGNKVAAAEHQAKSQKYGKDSKDHGDKSITHNGEAINHGIKQQNLGISIVPAGMSSCTTPDGISGFLPSASAGIISAPVPKTLREIPGQ
ncbi:MAG: hypothetical protein Q9M26_08735 [Mariprofundales bacterium]|nr:hypothetical protein [Mariprofundales bacterium]